MCHGVMYKQLAAWMLHGLLLDQSEDFYVKQGPSAGGAAANQEEDEEDLKELQDLVRALMLRFRISFYIPQILTG